MRRAEPGPSSGIFFVSLPPSTTNVSRSCGVSSERVATRATDALDAAGIEYELVVTEPASSAEESAEFQGIGLHQLLRTIVVRRGDDDYLFVLVPGGRRFDWPKLRAHLGVSRMSFWISAGQDFGWKAVWTMAPSRVRQVALTSSSSHFTASDLLVLSTSVSTKAERLRA